LTDDAALDAILALVRTRTGFDFGTYRRPTIARRVRNRMLSLGIDEPARYLAILEARDGEAAALLERLTIKVSRFYRDAAAFDLLRGEVLPQLERAAAGRPLRLWSAGCGRGEEPHSLAMLLEERGLAGEVLATDIDAGALAFARAGTYGEPAVGELPPGLRERFLVPAAGARGSWRVADAVRARIDWRIDDLSARGDMVDGFDLVCCRNVLIYLDRPTQERAMLRLARALAPSGYLLLGEAEWPSQSALPMLATLAHRQRLFRALPAQRLAA
jgi:chemotaxis methyl-accepting protein methylase